MKILLRAATCGLLICGMGAQTVDAVEQAAGKKGTSGRRTRPVPTTGTTVSVQMTFSQREVQSIREFYAPRHRKLPPGLEKKLLRTGQLPPGWQNRFEPFPMVLERQLVELPTGYHRGLIDGQAVIFNPRTNVIFDVAVVF